MSNHKRRPSALQDTSRVAMAGLVVAKTLLDARAVAGAKRARRAAAQPGAAAQGAEAAEEGAGAAADAPAAAPAGALALVPAAPPAPGDALDVFAHVGTCLEALAAGAQPRAAVGALAADVLAPTVAAVASRMAGKAGAAAQPGSGNGSWNAREPVLLGQAGCWSLLSYLPTFFIILKIFNFNISSRR
jgi:hypothetical protein